MSDEMVGTHEGARALAAMVLGRATPPAHITRHDYDPTQPTGRIGLEWRHEGNTHGAVLRYRLPCRERELRHDAAQIRDGKSHDHLR